MFFEDFLNSKIVTKKRFKYIKILYNKYEGN